MDGGVSGGSAFDVRLTAYRTLPGDNIVDPAAWGREKLTSEYTRLIASLKKEGALRLFLSGAQKMKGKSLKQKNWWYLLIWIILKQMGY